MPNLSPKNPNIRAPCRLIRHNPALGIKGKSPLFMAMTARAISLAAARPIVSSLDLVTCAFPAYRDFYSSLVNHGICDVNLEAIKGNSRELRVWIVALSDDGVSPVPASLLGEVFSNLPRSFKRPKARVIRPVTKTIDYENKKLGVTLPAGIRPSITRMARDNGLELAIYDGRIFLNGVEAAAADDDPSRVIASGILQMTADLKKTKNGASIIGKSSQAKRSDQYFAISGNRHHLEKDLLFHDYSITYTVDHAMDLMALAAIKDAGAFWTRVGVGFADDPWSEAVNLLAPPGDISRAGIESKTIRDLGIREISRELALEHDLTPRERQVLELLLRGKRNKRIADELSIGMFTVKTHVSAILGKTGKKNRSVLISDAMGKRK